MPLLFAYGTLRRQALRSAPEITAALALAECLGPATAPGRLHWMNAYGRRYPAMVRADPADPARVIGDVCRIDEAQCPGLWALLDSYEGDAYVRETIPIFLERGTLETGAEMTAFVYLAREAATLGARIESGDFLA